MGQRHETASKYQRNISGVAKAAAAMAAKTGKLAGGRMAISMAAAKRKAAALKTSYGYGEMIKIAEERQHRRRNEMAA
jgi:hypothetical protein